MSLYKQFKTDPQLEKNGIQVEYGTYRVTIARAGGANKKFARLLEAKTKPFKRAIQTETMDPERALGILREVYAEAVVLNWETLVDEDGIPVTEETMDPENNMWQEGIEAPDGTLLPCTPENLVKTFQNLPEIFTDIQEQASKFALFRETIREEDAKN